MTLIGGGGNRLSRHDQERLCPRNSFSQFDPVDHVYRASYGSHPRHLFG
jgi:hypothetical protein